MARRRCCCGGCLFANDDFNVDDTTTVSGWTEESGSWEIESDELVTGSNNAVITNNTKHPEDSPNMVVDVDFTAGEQGDQVRVIVAWDSSSDYAYVELTVDNTSSMLKFFEVVGGSVSQLGDAVDVGDVPVDTEHHIRVCYCDDCGEDPGALLSANININRDSGGCINYADLNRDAEVQTGTKGGLGTGSVTSQVSFDDFLLNKYDPSDPSCPLCGQLVCEGCEIDGELATQVQVSVSWNRTPSSHCPPSITWDCGCFDTICGSLTGQGGLFDPNSYILDLVQLCNGECIYYYCEHQGIDCSNDEDSPGEDCIDPDDPDRLYLIIVGETDFDTEPGKMLFTWNYYALWSNFAEDGDLCAGDVEVVLQKLAIIGGNECGQGLIGFTTIYDSVTSPGQPCPSGSGFYNTQPWGVIVLDAEGLPVIIHSVPPARYICDIFTLATPFDPVQPTGWSALFLA